MFELFLEALITKLGLTTPHHSHASACVNTCVRVPVVSVQPKQASEHVWRVRLYTMTLFLPSTEVAPNETRCKPSFIHFQFDCGPGVFSDSLSLRWVDQMRMNEIRRSLGLGHTLKTPLGFISNLFSGQTGQDSGFQGNLRRLQIFWDLWSP